MPKTPTVLTMQVAAADRSMVDRKAKIDGLAIVDAKLRRALLARDPATYEATRATRFLPWESSEPFVAWWVGDSEPMALHQPNRDYRTETAKITREESLRLNNERTDLAIVDAGRPGLPGGPWRMFGRVVSAVWIVVGILALVDYFRTGSFMGVN
jgi:hypothetical protein